MGPWLRLARMACANSSTRPRRRSMSAPPWRPGCVRPATPSSPRRISGHAPASSSSSDPGRWWPGTAATTPAVEPFRVIGGHTDSPNLRVKQHPDREVAGWQVVALEPYGGAWLNSWLDRDLGISGRLSVRDGAAVSRTDWCESTTRFCGCRSLPSIWPRIASRSRWIRSATSTRCGAPAAQPVLSSATSRMGRRQSLMRCWAPT